MVWVTNLDATPNQMIVHRILPTMQILASTTANGPLEFASKLNIESHPSFVRQTSIGATIGGMTRDIGTILELMENGMNICRINVSHRTREYHAETIHNIREAEKLYRDKTGQPFSCAIAIDTKGPEIRTGFKDPELEEIDLKTGHYIRLTSDAAYQHKCTNQVIYVNDPHFHDYCFPGVSIMIDDGKAMLQCQSIEGVCITCKILTDCILSDSRVVTIPNSYIDKPNISREDKLDFRFAIKQKADIILASFTHYPESINDIRKYLARKKGKYIKIVAKIEDKAGLENIDEIIQVSDGILIGKGHLGVQECLEKYFITQKMIASHCNKFGKPVICTRELWESITTDLQRPTLPEIIDVLNAIRDGVDCFLFAKENIKGVYQPQSLHFLSKACREAEATLWHSTILHEYRDLAVTPTSSPETIAIVAVKASIKGNASAIIVLTECGTSAHIISRYRPSCPILAVTRNEVTGRQSHLYRGIIPLVYTEPELEDMVEDMDKKVQYAIDNGRKFGFVDKNDFIVVVFEWGASTGIANSFRTFYVKERLDTVGKTLFAY